MHFHRDFTQGWSFFAFIALAFPLVPVRRSYSDGLMGEMIPLEARIMAVADVYDALVSKRVYKEPMSFEKAARIMCEGMGTQFDPNMRLVFLSCRQELERYYSSL